MSPRHALLPLLLLLVLPACSSGPAESKTKAGATASKTQSPEPAAAPKPAAPLYERTSAPVPPVLDPARVPVEEDFIDDAEQRIGKKSNLEQELQRLAVEIRTAAQAE